MEVRETVRMRPLPDENSGLWNVGTCLSRVVLRSYLVDVNSSLYRGKSVNLCVSEPEAVHAPESSAEEAPTTVTEPSPVALSPRIPGPGGAETSAPNPHFIFMYSNLICFPDLSGVKFAQT